VKSDGVIQGSTSPIGFFDAGTTGNVVIGDDDRVWLLLCGFVFHGGRVCALSAATNAAGGSEVDYNLGNFQGNSVASGPDRNLYVTEVSMTGTDSDVAQITEQGQLLHRFKLPAGSVGMNGPTSGIAEGADGNLWIVENGINKIARMTPRGTITQFPIPTANADARNITLAVDGSMWFTEYLGNKIGRITPKGIITEYSVPTAQAGVEGIMATTTGGCNPSRHGSLWFTEDNSGDVARLDF